MCGCCFKCDSLECGGRAPHSIEAHVKRCLASIAKCAATLVSRFSLAGVSSPVLERANTGAWRFRAGLSTS